MDRETLTTLVAVALVAFSIGCAALVYLGVKVGQLTASVARSNDRIDALIKALLGRAVVDAVRDVEPVSRRPTRVPRKG